MQPLLPFGGVVLQRRGVTQEIGGLALIVQFRGALARFGGIDEELCGLCGNGFVEGHGFRMAPFRTPRMSAARKRRIAAAVSHSQASGPMADLSCKRPSREEATGPTITQT